MNPNQEIPMNETATTDNSPLPKQEKIILKDRKALARMCAEQRSYITELNADREKMIAAYHELRSHAAAAITILGIDLAWAEVAVMALQQPAE